MKNFSQVVVVDFEYEVGDGNLPNVLCMVAYLLDGDLHHARTIRLWRGEFGSEPPFDIGQDTLFVAYSAWAEVTCFLTLGWKFPRHIFDLHTAYLAATNILLPHDPDAKRRRQSKRLPDACRSYGIDGWENIDKGSMAEDIGNGLWQKYGTDLVFQYCEEDVRASTLLLKAMLVGRPLLPPSDVDRVLHWSNYSAKAVAQIQAKGMPIDMPLWNKVQENKSIVIRYLLEKLDPSHYDDDPIFSPDGRFEYVRFERWLARNGVLAWPRTPTGMLEIKGSAFKLMAHVPGIEALGALRDSLGVIVRAKLPIGSDGRNRPKLFPFCTTTGRNAHTSSLYNFHAGLRGFMKFPPDAIGLYLDWRTQEVGVAAALSGDEALMAAYAGGDVYYELARTCGITDDPDRKHWKVTCPDERQRMKSLQLAISYGMSVPSLARGLDRHPLIASEIIEKHRRTYPRLWEWRNNAVACATIERKICSVFGWPLRMSYSPNERALFNFPMQANGAEMLRLAAWRLCEAGIVPNMLVHDGLLLEVHTDEQVEHAMAIMREAGRDVCDGFDIGVDVDQMLKGGARYADKRPVAQKMWKTIVQALRDVGAEPEE